MTGVIEGTIEANGLRFGYLAAGDRGPLALCLHGFPDSAWTWRHLLPALADAGFRAVAPWLRGYAPSEVPADGCYQTAMLGLDAGALHDALDGDGDAVLIGHDWGAFAGYAAVHDTSPAPPRAEPGGPPPAADAGSSSRWRRLVALAVPPPAAIAGDFFSYDQLQRSWYMFFFQHPLAEAAVAQDDLAFVDRLWADWSPGYDATDDLPHVKDALRDPVNLAAALGYYRATLGNVGLSSDPAVTALQNAAFAPPPLPTLYLHGRDDGCMGADLASLATPFLSHEGSRVEIVDGTGHFLHLERPDEVNRLVLDFVA
jgi:pimeloyl-ACP methyl ester carboxylesterase